MYRVAHMFHVVGHVNEVLIGFHPLEAPESEVKKQNACNQKHQQPYPQHRAGNGAIIIELIVPQRDGERPKECEPHNGHKHH